jgi:light-regulated signal transduction histidine kinase (bacteriophytochrome)
MRQLKRIEGRQGLLLNEQSLQTLVETIPALVGMGLSICRSIIDAHGGRLWAEPNEPRGTVFQFTLPSTDSISELVVPDR